MKEKKFVLVEGLSTNDLHRIYNRDKKRIESVSNKLGFSRLKSLKQRLITKDGFDIIQTTVKSGYGDWEYNLLIRVIPEENEYEMQVFTIINDATRFRKKVVMLWGPVMTTKTGNYWCPFFIKQHALERYYQRSYHGEFPGIKEAMTYILLNEMTKVRGTKSISIFSITVHEENVSIATRTGQFLAYTGGSSRFFETNPIVFNTFISNYDVDEQRRLYQTENQRIQQKLIRKEKD